MLPFKADVHVASRYLSVSIVHLGLFLLPLVPLAGCSNDGAQGPMASSLSTATDTTAETATDPNLNSGITDTDGEEDPKISMTATSTDVTAHLAWGPPPGFNVVGYNIYYGKRSPETSSSEQASSEESNSEESSLEEPELSACSNGKSQAVGDTHATIRGLEPDTEYFFAIQAFNETNTLCSNAITAVTPPVQS